MYRVAAGRRSAVAVPRLANRSCSPPARAYRSLTAALTAKRRPDEVGRILGRAMNLQIGSTAVTAVIALIAGCASSPAPSKNPSTEVQVNFNFPARGDASHKSLERGAISGVPQHVGFYYSVNPDCTSSGLVQTQLKTPPAHGSVAFVQADGYTNFSSTDPGYACNSRKSPGVEVMYTSAQDFVGTDRFTVQGIGPKGRFMETDYTVKVLAPVNTR